MAKVPKKLSEKQRIFVNAYMGKANGNATEAARIAGYKKPRSQGSRLLTNVAIKKEVERRQCVSVSGAIMDRDKRQERLTEIAEGGEIPCVCVECNKKLMLLRQDKDAIKAIDVLNKMDGDYITKTMEIPATPADVEAGVVQTLKKNPKLWKRIKKAVEGR